MNVIKQNENFFQNLNFYENDLPTRHIKDKRIDFSPCNKSIRQISFFQPISNDL